MRHKTCRDFFISTSSDEFELPATALLSRRPQQKRSPLQRRIIFQDRDEAKECSNGSCSNQVVPTSVTNTWQGVILRIESNDFPTIAEGTREGRFEAVSMGCDF